MRDIKVIFRREITRSITRGTVFYGSHDFPYYADLSHPSVIVPDIRVLDKRPRKIKSLIARLKLRHQSY